MTDRELFAQALEALLTCTWSRQTDAAITALRERLAREEPIFHLRSFGDVTAQQLEARQEQEPVAWITPSGTLYRSSDVDGCFNDSHTPLYTAPQPAQQPLSQYHIDRIVGRLQVEWPDYFDLDVATQLVRAIEAAHGITGEK